MEFNEKLQRLRKQKGLTQEELAEALFVSRTAISKWESGKGYPSIDSLKAISNYFSVTIDELLSADELLTAAEKENKEIIQNNRTLVFGLADILAMVFLFLPMFRQFSGNEIKAVSLLLLNDASPYIIAAFYSVVTVSLLLGILTLALQNLKNSFWVKNQSRISLISGFLSLILFIIASQPYAAFFSSLLFAIKAFTMIKRK